MFWAITPLQSGIFTTGTVTTSDHVSLRISSGFLPLADQDDKLSTNFLDIGYGISWLGQALPPFTLRGFTLLSFEAVDETDMSSNTTLTAKTMLYGTNLNCYPPAKILSESPLSLSFDNGKGCNGADLVQYSATPGKDFAAYYIGYWDNGNVDASL